MVAIPVVDLAAEGHGQLLLDACRWPGCFRVVNHGIPAALQAEMKAAVRSLFDLPADVKLRNADVIAGSGYMCPTTVNPLYEAFGLYDAASPADVDAFCSCLDAPPHHRETIRFYASHLHPLVASIASKIAESLGLVGYSFSDWPCQFRMNRYNFTPETVGSSGVQIHTDSGFLTVLQEDESVGGLEVMDANGTFVAVDPLPGSLLVNLGDVAKVWSNGILHNVKHRVLCKEAATRISIALFLLAPKDDKVEAPAELVGPKIPRLYRSFYYEDYRKLRFSSELQAGEALSLLAA
ncbi:2-oxoglutarate-dependent dioxygenase DAO-like [Ananas comosus]|uniref:2-oxoglutarate-dependent dioxygenase DAO n=1 Tax=Ananas comosus TaxID=4615 RepID=A0A199VED6_ANACO|nr:2-oxoglutarate-dependent dioxygenase DAO-like [Ananas comosus]OAY75140.1 2-oxoglutarate-dependent dioxygenase DAO [Ananas comosus]